MRTAGLGSVIGLDLPALLSLADAWDYPRDVMAHLLTLAQAGVVAGIREAQDTEDQIK